MSAPAATDGEAAASSAPSVPSARPAPFQVTSGHVIWGPMTTALEGAIAYSLQGDAVTVDTSVTTPQQLEGGTILQSNWHYVSLAQKGEWRVSRLFEGRAKYPNNDYRQPPISWQWADRPRTLIFHHSSANPVDIAKRCHKVGISLQQEHDDKRIKYVNRYDWGYHHTIPHPVRNVLGLGHPRTPPSVQQLLQETRRSEFVFADAAGSLDHIKNVLQHAEPLSIDKENYHLLPLGQPYAPSSSSSSSSTPSGVFVTLQHREYELGWLVFDDEKPDTLIGFVYDMYSTWSSGEMCPIKVEDEVILSLETIDQEIKARKDKEAKEREDTAEANRQVIATFIAHRGDRTVQQLGSDLYDLVKTIPTFKYEMYQIEQRCEDLQEREKANNNGAEPVIYKDIFEIFDEFENVRTEKEPLVFVRDPKHEQLEKERDEKQNIFVETLLSFVAESNSSSAASASASSTPAELSAEDEAIFRPLIDRLHAGNVPGELRWLQNNPRFPAGWISKLTQCSEKMRVEEVDKRTARAAELKRSFAAKHPDHPIIAAEANRPEKTQEEIEKEEDDWRLRVEKLEIRDEISSSEIFEVNADTVIEASAAGVEASVAIIDRLASELNNAGVQYKQFEEMMHYWISISSKKCGRNTLPVFEAILQKLIQLTASDAAMWGHQYTMYY